MVGIQLSPSQLYNRLEAHQDKLFDLDKSTVEVLVANRAIDAEGEYLLDRDFKALKNRKVTFAQEEANVQTLKKMAIIGFIAGAIILGAGIAGMMAGSALGLIGLIIGPGILLGFPMAYGMSIDETSTQRMEEREKGFHLLCQNMGRIQVFDDYKTKLDDLKDKSKYVQTVDQILAFQNLFNNQGV